MEHAENPTNTHQLSQKKKIMRMGNNADIVKQTTQLGFHVNVIDNQNITKHVTMYFLNIGNPNKLHHKLIIKSNRMMKFQPDNSLVINYGTLNYPLYTNTKCISSYCCFFNLLHRYDSTFYYYKTIPRYWWSIFFSNRWSVNKYLHKIKVIFLLTEKKQLIPSDFKSNFLRWPKKQKRKIPIWPNARGFTLQTIWIVSQYQTGWYSPARKRGPQVKPHFMWKRKPSLPSINWNIEMVYSRCPLIWESDWRRRSSIFIFKKIKGQIKKEMHRTLVFSLLFAWIMTDWYWMSG